MSGLERLGAASNQNFKGVVDQGQNNESLTLASSNNDASVIDSVNESGNSNAISEQNQGQLSQIKDLFHSFLTALEGILSGGDAEALNAIEEAKSALETDETLNEDQNELPTSLQEKMKFRAKMDGMLLGNYKSFEVAKSEKIDTSNKNDFIKKYLNDQGRVDTFNQYFMKYDAQYVVLEDGQELLRFTDADGRPVLDYMCGYIHRGDKNEFPTSTYYSYNPDGTYTTNGGGVMWEREWTADDLYTHNVENR